MRQKILLISGSLQSKKIPWKEMIREAKTKEAGVDPVVIFEILKSFPSNVLSSVKWDMKVDEKSFISDLSTIADDIFKGNENTLNSGK